MKKMHFIGIGGIGMSALAEIYLEGGYAVSGSDLNLTNITDRLEKKGAKIFKGHFASNVAKDNDIVIHSSCIKQDHPEVVAAKVSGLTVISRSELLKRTLERAPYSCGVTGTHGKTTTSTLIAYILDHAGKKPTVLLGGESEHFGGNAKRGREDLIVAEVDESDGFFRNVGLRYVVVTNVEREHIENYGTMENLISAFKEFMGRVPEDGIVVYSGEDKVLPGIVKDLRAKKISYGFGDNYDITCRNFSYEKSIQFDMVMRGKVLGTLKSRLIGRHNLMDILAAAGLCVELGCDFKKIQEAVENFRSVKRRFSLVESVGTIRVIEDYAHHPTELKAVIKAAHDYGSGRVIAVFQPHRHSRTHDLADQFLHCFDDCDILFLTEVYSAHEASFKGTTIKDIFKKMDKNRFERVEFVSKCDIPALVAGAVREEDIVLVLGAGDIKEVAIPIVSEIKKLHGALSR